MKTAMQELIEKLDYSIKNSTGDIKQNFVWIKFHCKLLVEIEKEQSLNLIRFVRTNDKMGKSIEDLYNEFLTFK